MASHPPSESGLDLPACPRPLFSQSLEGIRSGSGGWDVQGTSRSGLVCDRAARTTVENTRPLRIRVTGPPLAGEAPECLSLSQFPCFILTPLSYQDEVPRVGGTDAAPPPASPLVPARTPFILRPTESCSFSEVGAPTAIAPAPVPSPPPASRTPPSGPCGFTASCCKYCCTVCNHQITPSQRPRLGPFSPRERPGNREELQGHLCVRRYVYSCKIAFLSKE